MPQRKISTGSMHDDNIRKVSTAAIYEENTTNCSSESLVYTIERFFKSINTMSNIVMVPSKLYDIEDDSEGESETASSAASTCSDTSTDRTLFTTYKMLVDAKEDLVWCKDASDMKDEDVVELPEAKQFKYHLESLNVLLTNFSDLADHLSEKYQNAPGIKDSE